MPSCVAIGCSNTPAKKIHGVTFHRFPKKPLLRKAWIIACRRDNWMPSVTSTLCSQHFSEDQIDRSSVTTVRLRENAVPNIFKALPPRPGKVNPRKLSSRGVNSRKVSTRKVNARKVGSKKVIKDQKPNQLHLGKESNMCQEEHRPSSSTETASGCTKEIKCEPSY